MNQYKHFLRNPYVNSWNPGGMYGIMPENKCFIISLNEFQGILGRIPAFPELQEKVLEKYHEIPKHWKNFKTNSKTMETSLTEFLEESRRNSWRNSLIKFPFGNFWKNSNWNNSRNFLRNHSRNLQKGIRARITKEISKNSWKWSWRKILCRNNRTIFCRNLNCMSNPRENF